MKLSFFAGAFLLVLVTANAVEDEPKTDAGAPKKAVPKKHVGGFTGATPKPQGETPFIKKKKESVDAEAAPAKKKKTTEEDTDAAPPKKKTVAREDDTPAPKRRIKSADEDTVETPPKRKAGVSDETAKATDDALPVHKPPLDESTPGAAEKPARAPAAVLVPEELADFSAQPPRVQQLLTAALDLTQQNLTYTYGSDDPARGGMDCSGTIAYVLRGLGFTDVPRDSSGQYIWARQRGEFFAVVGKSADSFEFSDLEPGDLMFWTGTYETGREVPISHVMLYLGKERKTGKRVMFGASDGRSYNGIQRWGVSVFDFKMPRSDAAEGEKPKVDFVGYARIPGLRAGMAASEALGAVEEKARPPAVAPPTEKPAAESLGEPRKKPAVKPKRAKPKADL